MVRACWLIVVAVAAFAGANEVELVEAEPEKVKPPKNETPAELPICKGGCSGLSCAYPRMCKQMVAQHRAGVSKPLGDSRRGRAKRRPGRRLSRGARSRRSTATARWFWDDGAASRAPPQVQMSVRRMQGLRRQGQGSREQARRQGTLHAARRRPQGEEIVRLDEGCVSSTRAKRRRSAAAAPEQGAGVI